MPLMEHVHKTPEAQKQLHNLLETQGPPRPPAESALSIVMLKPSEIEADPAAYQFRLNSGKDGQTKDHEINGEQWDPILHGDPLIVHERSDGHKFVADGHHRLAFAKALNAKNQGPETLAAYILKESDGYTTEDAKIIAAYKNIARGDANIAEAALVLKEAHGTNVHKNLLPKINMDKGNLRAAEQLSTMGEDSIGLVAAGAVPVEMALEAAQSFAPDKVMAEIAKELEKSHAGRIIQRRQESQTQQTLSP